MSRLFEKMRGRGEEGVGSSAGRRGRLASLRRVVFLLGLFLLLVSSGLAVYEVRTSHFQAQYFSSLARQARFEFRPGPSSRMVFPGEGPFDLRMGYSLIPRFVERARQAAFEVEAQAQVSVGFEELVRRGYFPPYREKTQAGLTLLDRRGDTLFSFRVPQRVFPSFSAIPELVWKTLLFVESREFLDPRHPTRNPAVEWDRLVRSGFEWVLKRLGSDRNVPGASTLATQIEKYRHSPGGFTESPRAKLQQMLSASLRAYLDGPETLEAQRRIVVDYLNTVPLAAAPGFGEVFGIGDGLAAWFGTDFSRAMDLLAGKGDAPEGAPETGLVFRQVLGLILAQRRPSYFLLDPEGRTELHRLTDAYLRLLEREQVISPDLARAAAEARKSFVLRALPPSIPASPEIQKVAASVRASVAGLLGVESLYELDRLDLTVRTSLDGQVQKGVHALLDSLRDPAFVQARGLSAPRLLARGDPARVLYSVVIAERTPLGNLVRVQADNFEGPLNLNESSRLELGSTAKLRALVTYLEVLEALYRELASLPRDSLVRRPVHPRDALTRWAVEALAAPVPPADLTAFLWAALERRYSANPQERFVTGGGTQTFSNFDRTFDHRVLTVREGFQHSVNLVWVRLMRDLVNHIIYRSPEGVGWQVENPESPLRQAYIARFADVEGTRFVDRFYAKHRGKSRKEILDAVASGDRLGPTRLAWAFRAILPEASPQELLAFLREHSPDADLSEMAVMDLFQRTDPEGHSLSDLGFLSSVHPLELWVAQYLIHHPQARRGEVVAASAEARQEVYRWLFRTRRTAAQDTRIRFVLEMDAYSEIHESWRRLGYPFESLVPSLGTAIGSSGDRPSALAELVGILMAGGVRMPTVRVETLHFAQGTPFETLLGRRPSPGERVLSPEVAEVARRMLVEVVEEGTARRLKGALRDPAGEAVPIGGKTGTGDNRFRIFAPGGRLVESRVVNRTATFAFFLGDRYFGVVAAFVPGPEAGDYDFTSALPLEVLRALLPLLEFA